MLYGRGTTDCLGHVALITELLCQVLYTVICVQSMRARARVCVTLCVCVFCFLRGSFESNVGCLAID